MYLPAQRGRALFVNKLPALSYRLSYSCSVESLLPACSFLVSELP